MNGTQPPEVVCAIDTHAHFYPRSYIDLIARHGAAYGARCSVTPGGMVIEAEGLRTPPLGPQFTDIDTRLAMMDRQGVRMQALSLTQPMVYWAPGDLALDLCVAYNDAVSTAHRAYPDRVVGLAMLPMHDPPRAITEIERVRTLSGIRGVYLATTINGHELADRMFYSIYERIEALRLPVFLHPIKGLSHERMSSWYLHNSMGYPFETALAAAHLIFGGVLDDFPMLEVCLPHAGGALPALIGRLDHAFAVRPECKALPRAPREYLQRFYYDTISHSESLMRYLVELVGVERIVLGSDYCFNMGYADPLEKLNALQFLTPETRARIAEGNARALLRL
jgi:aminocarboxymuconate-semialdehyde decarboxylase